MSYSESKKFQELPEEMRGRIKGFIESFDYEWGETLWHIDSNQDGVILHFSPSAMMVHKLEKEFIQQCVLQFDAVHGTNIILQFDGLCYVCGEHTSNHNAGICAQTL